MIKPVKKVKIIVPKDIKEELLITLQKEEIVMINQHDDSTMVNTEYQDELISRTSNALNKLGEYKKKGRKFFHQTTTTFTNFINNKEKRIKLLKDVEAKFDELHFLNSENIEEQKLINAMKPFSKLEYTTKELSESLYSSFHLGYITDARWDVINDYANRTNLEFVAFEHNEKGHHVLIYLDVDDLERQLTQLKRFGFIELKLPIIDETVKEYIAIKTNIITQNEKVINEIESYLSDIADNQEIELKTLVDQTKAEKDRLLVAYKEEDDDVIFDCWISLDKATSLQGVVRTVTLDYQLEFEDPTELDYVPTLLENNKFVQPFESITNTYSVPNYREIDPNPLMSIWYWIIFGVLIGDIGYGLLLLIGGILLLKIMKPKGGIEDLVKVFTYSGITATIMGVISGSVFGVGIDLGQIVGNLFNQPGWTTVFLQPMADPMTMLIFSLGLGILHMGTGLILKIITSYRRKRYLDGLADGLSWLFILIGITLIAINMVTTNTTLGIIGTIFAIFGLGLILVAGGLRKEGIVGKIFGGLGGLFDITSYLSDILSYSRILALALSTAVIAYTMNTLAGLIQGSILGIILSLVIYLVGHVFNMAISLLSAYVQNNRLQYLEYYGKFYEGGGYLFKPLAFETEHIQEIIKTEEQ